MASKSQFAEPKLDAFDAGEEASFSSIGIVV
jgi:hypothetical protein